MEASCSHTTHAPEETRAVAAQVVEALQRRERAGSRATIVALQGDLGAGKTVFAAGVAAALGVEGVVTSPTFVIQKVYPLPHSAHWQRLVHIDAYRMEGVDELETIDWSRVVADPGNVVLVEWPEQVGEGVPEHATRIVFEEIDESTRVLHVSYE